jgi:hypothetical protein
MGVLVLEKQDWIGTRNLGSDSLSNRLGGRAAHLTVRIYRARRGWASLAGAELDSRLCIALIKFGIT